MLLLLSANLGDHCHCWTRKLDSLKIFLWSFTLTGIGKCCYQLCCIMNLVWCFILLKSECRLPCLPLVGGELSWWPHPQINSSVQRIPPLTSGLGRHIKAMSIGRHQSRREWKGVWFSTVTEYPQTWEGLDSPEYAPAQEAWSAGRIRGQWWPWGTWRKGHLFGLPVPWACVIFILPPTPKPFLRRGGGGRVHFREERETW